MRRYKPASIGPVSEASSTDAHVSKLENEIMTLLNQYPYKQLRLTWTMRIHIQHCDECKYHLRHMIPGSAQLPRPLSSPDTCQICDQISLRPGPYPECDDCKTKHCNDCNNEHKRTGL